MPNSGGALEATSKFNPFHLKTGTYHTGYEEEMTLKALWTFFFFFLLFVGAHAPGSPTPSLFGEEFSVPEVWVDLEPLPCHQSPWQLKFRPMTLPLLSEPLPSGT